MRTKPFRLLRPSDIKNLPPPKWILEEFIQEQSTILLYVSSGAGKSFVALEMVCCLATQDDTIFKPVVTGPVVYITAEGEWGMGLRLKAWEAARGKVVPDGASALFITEAVQLSLEVQDVEILIKQLKEALGDQQPILIMFDTLARCAVGLDENSARDMGKVVAKLDQIRDTFRCSVMLVHHSTKASRETERGSGAIFGAMDTVFYLDGKPGDPRLVLKCKKQKNGAPAPDRHLTLLATAESCVLDPSQKAARDTKADDGVKLAETGQATRLKPTAAWLSFAL